MDIKVNESNSSSVALSRLSENYYRQADRLTERLSELRQRVKEKPPADELAQLELRIYVLRQEIYELRQTALILRREASPAPPSPSLSARMRGA